MVSDEWLLECCLDVKSSSLVKCIDIIHDTGVSDGSNDVAKLFKAVHQELLCSELLLGCS